MAIMVTFAPAAMTADQYDEVIRRLEAAGAGTPPGRLYHVAARTGPTMRVVDVYDSPQSFEAFGQSLLPILQEVGVSVPPPEIAEVHASVTGGGGPAR